MGPTVARRHEADVVERPRNNEATASGVSWAAVFAGAIVTAALSLILLSLGAGLDVSSISVWSSVGASASTIGAAAIVWLITMQMISSSIGGYLAGRLRTKWATVHTDEVYFRDTAHGFLAWAIALVITAAFLATAATSMVGTTGSSVSGDADRTREADPTAYFVDTLFRSEGARTDATPSERGESSRVLANAIRQGAFPAADRRYLAQLVASKTGLSQADADKTVSEVFRNAQQTLEATRKAVAHFLLWAFIAFLIGAFCASFAATIGGRQRDGVVIV
jgi:hypothetical protein